MMADPFDKLFNDPEWQAYEARVGPKVAGQTLAQIESKYRSKNNTQVIPSTTPTKAPAAAPSTFSMRKPVMSEIARKAKLSDQANDIEKAGQELQNLYDKKIKKRIESGELSSVGQGLDYTYPGISRAFGGKMDPDVQEFITKSGQFATLVNSYYAQSSGGRGGVQQFKEITSPHIPHPPSGAIEVLGLSPETQQWDLQKQGEQIPVILNNVRLQEGKRPVQSYGDSSAGIAPLDDAAAKHGVDW
jgi:hypothetical protein